MQRLGLLALLAIAALGAFAGWIGSQIERPDTGRRPDKVFVDIPRGTSRWQVAGILRHDDIIRNRLAFALLSEWHHRRPLQAGEYLFDSPMDSRDVFWKISRGQIFLHTVVIPEGWTIFDIAAEMERQGLCGREAFVAAAHDTAAISDLAPGAHTLEGFLFPSTYEFTRRTTCAQAAATMVRRFRTVLDSLGLSGQGHFADGLTLRQIVTLASLVERETPNAGERPLIAGVFYNRMDRDYPLQCDPTVQYALELEGHRKRDVQPQDLRIDSPYNTYEHPGLPPGPIANPGEASLRAALTPARTDYVYFVANNQGGHSFGRTLAEHNRNVARLRDLLAHPGASSDPVPQTKER